MSLRSAALFDFDITLTRGDSFIRFLLRLLKTRSRSLVEVPTLLALLPPYAFGLVGRERMKDYALRLLRRVSPSEREALVADFCAGELRGSYRAGGLERIRWHREQGHVLVLASASVDLYLEQAARDLGFDFLLCTRTSGLAAMPSPVVVGPNCRDEEKVRRLRELPLSAEIDWDASYAYSDSTADLPMLRLCGHPVAANPNRKLARQARRAGWEIVHWP